MRASGLIHDTRGFGCHDHLCWAFRGADEFRARAVPFLVDGLAQGQRVWYVAPGDAAALAAVRDELVAAPGGDRPDAVRVTGVEEAYAPGLVITPSHQVRTYATATEVALAEGFHGLRVAADATGLVRTPEQRDRFARYEHLIDRYMARHPLAALCAYDAGRLAPGELAEIACLHPSVSEGLTPFRLHATGGADAALAGEVDLAGRDLFERALDRAGLRAGDAELVIDSRDLTFIDHRGMLALDRYARDHGVVAVLRTASATPRRLVDLLELGSVRVELPADDPPATD